MMSFDTSSPLSTLAPDSSSPPTPSPALATTSTKHLFKIILRAALQKANAAVVCDSANDVMGAIDAYSEAIALLNRVLANVDKDSDRQRLQEIHDSYSERIRLLTAMTPKGDPDDLYETYTNHKHASHGEEEPDAEGKSWLARATTRRISDRVQRSTQQAYSAIIRRMASSSSIESAQSLDQRQSFGVVASAATFSAPKLSPAPQSSSRSTPNHVKSNSRRPVLPKLKTVHDSPTNDRMRMNAHNRANDRRISVESIASSIDSQSSTDSEVDSPTLASSNLQPTMTLPSIHKFDKRGVNFDHDNDDDVDDDDDDEEEDDVDDGDEEELDPMSPRLQTSSSSISRMRTSSLPRLLDVDPPSPVMYEHRPSVSMTGTAAPTMRRAHTQPQQLMEAENRPVVMRQLSGLGSVRKKSNRLSRSSIDGDNRLERGGLTPIFGMYMNDMMSVPGANYEPSAAFSPTTTEHHHNRNSSKDPLKLLLHLEKSLLHGGYISSRLFIPKSLWHQSSVRLASLDIKVAACEGLTTDISRLERWTKLDDVTTSLRLMDVLEEAVEGLRSSLSKKLKRDSLQDPPGTPSREGFIEPKKSQTFMSWGTKLSKSVERMNAFSLTKAEDQYRHYIEALQVLLSKIHVLEDWLQHYAVLRKEDPRYEICTKKLTRICELISTAIGGFVVRDATILLDKWLKRGGSWVND